MTMYTDVRPGFFVLATRYANGYAGQAGTVRLWEVSGGACLRTLPIQRRYERLDITGLTGVTATQRHALLSLGAVDHAGGLDDAQ